MFDDFLKNELDILNENNWLNKKEADKFFNNEELIKIINVSTSPKKENIFNALKLTPYFSTRVLILGQDPYPNPLDAHGLAFSSLNNATPDSLKNIFIAIDKIYNSNLYKNKYNVLTNWAKQGVLLLNTGLTYQKIEQNNLNKNELKKIQTKTQNYNMKLWRPFINHIILKLLNIKTPLVMFLWGDKAQKLIENNIIKNKINVQDNILILKSSHPSPLSVNRGGDFPAAAPEQFKKCNEFLEKNGKEKINWNLLN